MEIEKTKPTFIISTFKIDIIKLGLVFSISNFFIAKTSLANNWRSFSSSCLALRETILSRYDFFQIRSGSGNTYRNGTCFTSAECIEKGGAASGSCAGG